ncbi:hypothetical protein E3V55_00680 [Candidatus Marinimicrobia bacterium MT.SAG.3]|nr:hypothetical protein E3V55_00680 [Candidatus Marinimicrobia bacterium MT.SAG.3]
MKLLLSENIKKDHRDDGRVIQKLFSGKLAENFNSFAIYVVEIPAGTYVPIVYHTKSVKLYYFITSGSVSINGDNYKFSPEDAVLIEPGEPHAILTESDTKLFEVKIPDESDKIVLQEDDG